MPALASPPCASAARRGCAPAAAAPRPRASTSSNAGVVPRASAFLAGSAAAGLLRTPCRRSRAPAPPSGRRRVAGPVAGLFGLGLPELVVIGGVVAVLFGPSKLPELGKSLGKTVKSFQTAAKARARALLTAAAGRGSRTAAGASALGPREGESESESSVARSVAAHVLCVRACCAGV